jgi:hypothetical protein
MVEESRAVRTRQTLDALDERTRVQQIRSVALSGIQGKPLGPVASNVLLESDAKLYRAPKVEGRWRRSIHLGRPATLQKVNRPAS